MEQFRDDELKVPGRALFFKRTGPRDEPDDDAELDIYPPDTNGTANKMADQQEQLPPELDDLAKRVADMAGEAAVRYVTWAGRKADEIIASARQKAAAEAAEASEKAAAVVSQAQATATEILQQASETRLAAEAMLAEAKAKSEALLLEAEVAAERARNTALAAAAQEANALIEAKRAEVAEILSNSRTQAEVEGMAIRERALRAAEEEAQRLRDEAATVSRETRERALALTEAVIKQLRSAASAMELSLLAHEDLGEQPGTMALSPQQWAAEAIMGGTAPVEEIAPTATTSLPATRDMDAEPDVVSKIFVMVSPIRRFEQLFVLEGRLANLSGVVGVEVVDIDGLLARMSVSVTNMTLFVSSLGQLPEIQTLTHDSSDLIRLTLNEQQVPQR